MTIKKQPKRGKSIGNKLNSALKNLSMDIFGYEQKATASIIQYFEAKARESGLVARDLSVWIGGADPHPARLRHGEAPLRAISPLELIRIFTGQALDEAALPLLQPKVQAKLHRFFQLKADELGVAASQLSFVIQLVGSGVEFGVRHGRAEVLVLGTREVIKAFG